MLGQRQLILALGVNRFLPEMRPDARREIEHGAGKNGVGGAVGRDDQADRFEGFADDEGDAVLGGFQEKLAMDAGREAGDDDRCHVLQRQSAFAFRRFAGQLAVSATQGALRRVYADDVIGHTTTSLYRQIWPPT